MSPNLFLTLTLALLTIHTVQATHYALDSHFNIVSIPSELSSRLLEDPEIVATASFVDDRISSGWTYYTYQANPSNEDWLQLYAAGYLEGYLLSNLMFDVYSNHVSLATLPASATEFIDNQTSWIFAQIAANPQDTYWDLVNSTFAQQNGLYDGYQAAISLHNLTNLNLTYGQIYLLSYLDDLHDVTSKVTGIPNDFEHCSFLLRMTNDSLFASHTSWAGYTNMLKAYKILTFNLSNPLVQTNSLSFSSFPGSVPSQDDFYILDHNRLVAETTLSAHNNSVYYWIHYDSVPYWIRVTVANLAYDTQETWANIFFNYRSGTYNNQWLVVDFNNFNSAQENISNASNIIWIIEELYNLSSAQDVTQQLLIPQGYVGSYNVAYNETLYNMSLNPTNYTNDTRAILFKKYAPGIQDMSDFQAVMRLNNHSDTENYCEAIAARCDLNPTSQGQKIFGAIDCKATSDSLIPNHQAWIQVGPTHENLTAFSWANWPSDANVINGLQEVYDFDWVFVDPQTGTYLTAEELSTGQVLVEIQ